MMYKLTHRYFMNQESHCFTINEFDIQGEFDFEKLLGSNIFDYEIQPDYVKNSQDDKYGYLRGLFKSRKLEIVDFKYIKAKGIYYYLEGFSDCEEEWGEDKPLFKILLEQFKEISKSNLNGSFLINKEWFDKDSKKVKEREYLLYDYYFIIVWVDRKEKSKFYISEWFSD